MALLDLIKFPLNEIANDRADYNDHYDIRIDALKKALVAIATTLDSGGVPPGVGPIKDSITTMFSTPLVGEIGYISGNSTLSRARGDVLSTARAYGAYSSTGVVCTSGTFPVLFVSGLSPVAGNVVYLSNTVAGRATTVAPATSGQYIIVLGILKDATGYNSGTGSALPVNWDAPIPVLIP